MTSSHRAARDRSQPVSFSIFEIAFRNRDPAPRSLIRSLTTACRSSALLGRAAPDRVAQLEPFACGRLPNLRLSNVKVLSAESVSQGSFDAPAQPASQTSAVTVKVPELCRARGESNPTANSAIGWEVWFLMRTWNGKFLALGSGGSPDRSHTLPCRMRSDSATRL